MNVTESFHYGADFGVTLTETEQCVCVRILQDCAVEYSEYFSIVFRDTGTFPPIELAVAPIKITDDFDGEVTYNIV